MRVHDTVYQAARTAGSATASCWDSPSLLLHTVGAKTGTPRTNSLSYARDGGYYLDRRVQGRRPQGHRAGTTT